MKVGDLVMMDTPGQRVHGKIGIIVAKDLRPASEGRLVARARPVHAGKTSIVNLIAGLTRPDRGRIVVDGQ